VKLLQSKLLRKFSDTRIELAKNIFISFKNNMIYINKMTQEYLSKIPSHVKVSEFPLTKIDPSKLEGYQREYQVFDGVSMPDIAFITKNLDTFNFFRGCKEGCLQCLKKAIVPPAGRETILYEDFKRFVIGFAHLSEKLGFNVLNGNKFIRIADDSEPIGQKIRGLNKEHTLKDMIKMFYKNLRIPVLIETSGWESQKNRSSGYYDTFRSAQGLVNLAKSTPDAIKEVRVSVNPFMPSATYVPRMVDTIRLFLDLFKMNKAKVVCTYAPLGNEDFDVNALKNIYEKIYSQLQRVCGENIEYIPELKPEVVIKNAHEVLPIGSAKKFFSEGVNDSIRKEYSMEKKYWNGLSKSEQKHILMDKARKFVDIDGSIYTENPIRTPFNDKNINVTIPTDIKLNFSDKTPPYPIYRDVNF